MTIFSKTTTNHVWWCLILWLCGYNCVDYTWIYQIVSGNESKVFQHLSIPRLISSMRYELTEGCRLIILYHLLFLLYNVVRHLSTFTFVILFYKVKERCTCKTKQFEFHTDYKGTEHYRKKNLTRWRHHHSQLKPNLNISLLMHV